MKSYSAFVDGGYNFLVHNFTCGRFHTVTFETVSLLFSYIYLRIRSYLGPRGEPPFFRTCFRCSYPSLLYKFT